MSLPQHRPIKLKISSLPAHLPVVRGAVEKLCEQIGFDHDVAGEVVLSVDEALANIIKHVYGDRGDQAIEIELSSIGSPDSQGVEIRLRDYGRWVDPATIKSRDLADVRPGGLGVHIMNQCMDSVEYAPAEGGGTLLTMTRKLVKTSTQEVTK